MEAEGYGYESAMGRAYWPNRDPIGIRGGLNLYGMCGNDAINQYDYLGRAARSVRIVGGQSTLTDGKIGFSITLEHTIPEGANTVQTVNVTTTYRGHGGESRSMWSFVDNWPSAIAIADNWKLQDHWDGPTEMPAVDDKGRRMCEVVQDNQAQVGTASWDDIKKPARRAGLNYPGYSTGTPLAPTPEEPDTFILDPETQMGQEALDRINEKLGGSISFGLKVTWSATGNGGQPKETYETSGALGK
jgi:hypothetical protein